MPDLSLFDQHELLALVKLDIENKQLEGALAKLKHLTQQDACPAEAYSIAGKLYAQLQLFEHAEAMFQRFLAIHPNEQHTQFELGMVMLDQSKADEALKQWSKILEQDAMHPPSLFYSAAANLQLGKLSESKSLLEIILQHIPASNLYYGRAREELARLGSDTELNEKSDEEKLLNH